MAKTPEQFAEYIRARGAAWRVDEATKRAEGKIDMADLCARLAAEDEGIVKCMTACPAVEPAPELPKNICMRCHTVRDPDDRMYDPPSGEAVCPECWAKRQEARRLARLRERLMPGTPIFILGPPPFDGGALVVSFPLGDTVEYRVSNGATGKVNIANVCVLEAPKGASDGK